MTWVYSGILLKSLTSEWLHSICCTQNYRKANKTDITDMNSTKTYTPKIFYNSQTIFRAEEKWKKFDWSLLRTWHTVLSQSTDCIALKKT